MRWKRSVPYAAAELARHLVDQRAGGVELGPPVGQQVADGLVGADGLAELLALLRVLPRRPPR